MVRLTANGRPVFLRVLKWGGYQVVWGRTILSRHASWRAALDEILGIYKEYAA